MASTRPDLYKTNWKKDIVYLYTFPRPKIMPTLSPFTLKVETFLRAHQLKYEDGLTGVERGAERAVGRMVDLSTFYALQQDRVVKNAQSFLSSNITGLPLPSFVTNLMAPRFANTVRSRVDKVLGRLTKDEVNEVLRRDVQALDDILGDKKFLFGDRISVADCVIFGHVGSCYYLPYRQYITDLLDDDFPRVKGLVSRIRTHYFPEWKDN